MADDAAALDILALTAQIVSAHVKANSVSADLLPELIRLRSWCDTGSCAGAAAACGSRQEVRLPGLHRVPGGRQEAEDAEAASDEFLQHDA